MHQHRCGPWVCMTHYLFHSAICLTSVSRAVIFSVSRAVSRCIIAALVGMHDALLAQSLCVSRCGHELVSLLPISQVLCCESSSSDRSFRLSIFHMQLPLLDRLDRIIGHTIFCGAAATNAEQIEQRLVALSLPPCTSVPSPPAESSASTNRNRCLDLHSRERELRQLRQLRGKQDGGVVGSTGAGGGGGTGCGAEQEVRICWIAACPDEPSTVPVPSSSQSCHAVLHASSCNCLLQP